MTNQAIIIAALFLMYFHISGLATTNILRLTAGNTTPVLASKCYCDHCGATIPPLLQLPIISYIWCKGKCRKCGTKIPIFPLAMELTILMGMFFITVFGGCTVGSVSISYGFYELVRIAAILFCGKRTEKFAGQYVIAVLAMIPFYVLTLFAALLYSVV